MALTIRQLVRKGTEQHAMAYARFLNRQPWFEFTCKVCGWKLGLHIGQDRMLHLVLPGPSRLRLGHLRGSRCGTSATRSFGYRRACQRARLVVRGATCVQSNRDNPLRTVANREPRLLPARLLFEVMR
jgi:hypothetical protein